MQEKAKKTNGTEKMSKCICLVQIKAMTLVRKCMEVY